MQRIDKEVALQRLQAEGYAGEAALGCSVCRLASARARGADCVAADAHGLVLLNRYGCRPGHLLVIARQHVEHADQLAWEDYAALQRLVYLAARALRSELRPLRVYTATLGSASPLPNSYPHLHVHVVPVHDDDERSRPARVFTWSEGVVVYDDAEAEVLATRMRAHFVREAEALGG